LQHKLLTTSVIALLLCLYASAFASEATPAAQAPTKGEISPFSTVGVGIKASTLGAGIDFAVPVTHRSNVRIGVNGLNYNRTFDKDDITYKGKLALRSVQMTYDIFPFAGSFHLSPGMLLYNGTKVTADASVAGGKSFDLGDDTFVSSSTDPITGTGNLKIRKAAPMFLFGFGNLVPRKHSRHFTASIEAGVVFQGTPKIGLNFSGSGCDSTGLNCSPVASDPTFQTQLVNEQNKLNRDVEPFKYYPVISFGFGYRF
jgi:hypothetical protein